MYLLVVVMFVLFCCLLVIDVWFVFAYCFVVCGYCVDVLVRVCLFLFLLGCLRLLLLVSVYLFVVYVCLVS